MNLTDPRFILDVLQTLVIVLLWMRKPGQDAISRLVKTDGRLEVLEERLKHMPTTDELMELEGTVKAMSAQLAGMDDAVKTTRSAVVRIEDFLRANR